MDTQPPSSFKSDEDNKNVDRSAKPPQCMLDTQKPNANRQPLKDSELELAKTDLLNKSFVNLQYPRNLKFRVDPRLPGQSIGLVSFLPAKGASPDSEGCFGVLKVRGNFPTAEDAENWSENLIRNYDSFAEIDLVYVGRDFPLMVDNSLYTSSTREIDIRKKVDDVTKSALRTKRENEEKEIKTIQERQQKLLNPVLEEDKEECLDDLDYYTQLKVKKANADMLIDEATKKIQEAKDVSDKTVLEIEKIEAVHPEHKTEYMARYENALKAVGADSSKNPLIKYM